MYQTTDALHAALNSQRLHLRITPAGADPIADVLKLTYSASCCAGDSIGVGNVCAAAVTAKLAGKQMLENTAILVEVGAEVDGEIQYVPFGSFVVSEQQHEEDVTSVTAYDAVYYALGGTYLPADPAPTTALAVLRDICAQTGLELAASNGQHVPIVGEAIVGEAVVGGTGEMPDVDISGDLTGKSCREMVGCMAALLGCNALIDRDGKLRLLWFADSGLTLTADDYYSGGLVLEGTVTLAGISVNKTTRTTTVDEDGVTSETETTETLRAGEGSGTVMELDNEFCDQSIVDAVWAAIGGLGTYQIGSCTFAHGLLTEPGDLVRVTARDGTPALLPAMSVQLELDGGCKCTISASGQSTTAEGANVQGPTGQALKRIQADIAEFKRLYVENLFAEKARINNLYADEAWLTNLFAQDITATGTIRGVTLEGTNGTIGGWNISQYALDQTGTRTVSGVAYDYRYVIQAPSDANGWGSVIAVQRKAEGAENWEYLAQLTYTGALSVQNVNVAGFAVPQIQHGAVSVTVTANTAASFSVTFPRAFSGVPDVVFTPRHNSNVTSLSYKLMSVTSSGFTGYVYSSNAGGHVIHWIAMY